MSEFLSGELTALLEARETLQRAEAEEQQAVNTLAVAVRQHLDLANNTPRRHERPVRVHCNEKLVTLVPTDDETIVTVEPLPQMR